MRGSPITVASTWRHLFHAQREQLEHRAGLYCLWIAEQPAYIGTARDLYLRLMCHAASARFSSLPIDKVTWLHTKHSDRYHHLYVESKTDKIKRHKMESYLIKKHKPQLNSYSHSR